MQSQFHRWVAAWSLQIDETRETPTAVLGFGRRASTPIVLKVARAGVDEWASGAVIEAFAGHGMVRALEVGDGAVLLERLLPGSPLTTLSLGLRDDEATLVLADLLERLVAPGPVAECATVHDWSRGFQQYLDGADQQIPRALIERGRAWYLALAESQHRPRLLHGDLQHYNVLADTRRGWVAIDPKGVVAEPEYEVGAILRNPTERLADFATPAVVEQRVRLLTSRLPLVPDRTLAWAYAQAVLSAIWMVEDGHRVPPGHPLFRLLRAVGTMIPVLP